MIDSRYIGIDYEFQSQASEQLESVEDRLSTLETLSGKPLAPGTTLTVDGSTGDDSNDGFTAPVLTLDRLRVLLDAYDWGNGSITVEFNNITISSGETFYGNNVTNISLIDFLGNGSQITTSIFRFRGWNPTVLRITDWSLSGAGGILIEDSSRVIASLIVSSGSTGSKLLTATRCGEFIADFDNINNPTGLASALQVQQCLEVVFQYSSLTSVTVSDALIDVLDSVNYVRINGFGDSITGKVLDVTQNSNASINIQGLSSITGSVTSTYPPTASLDGDGGIRGTFADDTAAGTGGVLPGEVYEQTGGSLFVKQ